jgi:hypothetical protein
MSPEFAEIQLVLTDLPQSLPPVIKGPEQSPTPLPVLKVRLTPNA